MALMFSALRKYAQFQGRASRREFWSFAGLCAAVFIGLMVMAGIAGMPVTSDASKSPPIWPILYILWWFGTAIPWFAVQVRRFHDQGRSGAFALINLAAYLSVGIGVLPALALYALSMSLMLLPGEAETNRFGPVPDDVPLSNWEDDQSGVGDYAANEEEGAAGIGHAVIEKEPPSASGRQGVVVAIAAEVPLVTSSSDYKYITPTSDGRFSYGGYSFSTREQALRFAERRRNPSPFASSPNTLSSQKPAFPPNLYQSPSAPVQIVPIEHDEEAKACATPEPEVTGGVVQTKDGRFSAGGYSFSTYDQASRYEERKNSAPPAVSSVAADRSVAGQVPATRSGIMSRIIAQRPTIMPARWIASATEVVVDDITFTAELLYFGRWSRSSGHRALVNPELPLGNRADTAGQTLGYWPSYGDLNPAARRAYIQWLAAGRREPTTPIGYVFLYFYGLERRLIAEKSREDAPAILDELHILLDIYGSNHSFQRYARALLDASEVMLGIAPAPPRATLDMRYNWELPFSLRLHLGRKVRDGVRIDAEDALCWTLSHPQLSIRTPAQRCFEEFRTLWHARFDEHFPEGIKVRAPKSRLSFHYRSASSEFSKSAITEDLPDVGACSGPLSKFDALLSNCTDALEPLSRLLGRAPEERGGVLATALCPAEAREGDAAKAFLAARRSFLSAADMSGMGQLSVGAVLAALLPDQSGAGERRAAYLKRLPDILDAMNIGFEPDRRFGSAASLTDDTILCLFERTGLTQPVEGRKPYQLARTMVEVAVLAAMADAVVVEVELQSIVSDLAMVAGLDEHDRQRLHAHSVALVANPPKLRAATKRLLELPEEEKDFVLTSAVHAILADQRVTPTEVRFLEGLYKAAGRPQDDVYARLHSGTVVRKAAGATRSSGRNEHGSIDSARLERIQNETASVSAMLAGIFKDAETESTVAPQQAVDAGISALRGLDQAHSRVLLELTRQPLEAENFEALCRENRLLPGGAIETINDWAFDQFDDLAVEDEDLICIQPHLIEVIKNMSIAA